MAISSTLELATFDENIRCASNWFILTLKKTPQNVGLGNLKCVTYPQPWSKTKSMQMWTTGNKVHVYGIPLQFEILPTKLDTTLYKAAHSIFFYAHF